MTREEFIKQRCEIDKITEEEFEKRYRVVKCNCGQPYCKGYRCLDLDGLLKENQSLKKQLETYEIEGHKQEEELDKMSFDIRKYKTQQKEFISYLENEIYNIVPKGCGINFFPEDGYDSEEDFISAMKEQSRLNTLKEILSKYREIIGGK